MAESHTANRRCFDLASCEHICSRSAQQSTRRGGQEVKRNCSHVRSITHSSHRAGILAYGARLRRVHFWLSVSWRSEEMQSWLVRHILAGETTDGNGRCRKSLWRENGHYLEIMQSKVNILLPVYLKHSQISTQSSYYSREEMSKWSINAIYTYRKLAIDKTIFIF